jgi:hypothetical protein
MTGLGAPSLIPLVDREKAVGLWSAAEKAYGFLSAFSFAYQASLLLSL